MRIERIRVGAFGRLKSLDTGSEPLPPLVVVQGPNEAGKSTLFHFLTSMLYGFHPASREGNPYVPWDGTDTSGDVRLRLDAGTYVSVERRLLSQPNGRMEADGTLEDLRNRALPWAEHVPHAVFRQVFAVTLTEMQGLDDETWGHIQDRLLGAMGSLDLRPARHVVAELEEEAARIWRPNRRGNQRARSTAAEILTLKTRRREAVERERRLRELATEVERVRRDLRDAREVRRAALLELDRLQDLVPVRKQLIRIAALRETAGPPETLRGLPTDPAGEMRALQDRMGSLGRRLGELRAEKAEPQSAVDAFGSAERELLSRSDDVSVFLARRAELAAERDRHAVLENEARELRGRMEAAAAQVLSAPLTDDVATALARVPVADLRERIRRAQAAREERRVREAAAVPPGARSRPAPALAVAAMAVLASAAVLLWVGLSGGGTLATGAGALVGLVGVALLLAWSRGRAAGPMNSSRHPASATETRDDAETAAVAAVADILGGLPVSPSLLEPPSEALVSSLERLQDLIRDHDERSRTADASTRRLRSADETAAELARALGRGADLDAQALASLLERDLRRAQRVEEAAAASERELRRLAREEERTRQELAEAEATLAALRERLAAAGDGDPDVGLAIVRERIQAGERAEQLEAELERAHPDLDALRHRIGDAEAAGERWTREEDEVARRRTAVEDLTHRVEELATRAEGLDKELAHLRTGETVDAIDGQIATLEEEELTLLQERDRLWVLAQVLKEADRRFRDEHQPDVLRRAGEHLGALTCGRYDRVIAEESSGGERFQLLGRGSSAPVPLAAPVSRGTLEQAYLALRFAIVDHLDQGLERLPLFVDEVFVDWDEERRARGMDLLERMAHHRQIFVFSCHPEVADDLRPRGARVLLLDAAR